MHLAARLEEIAAPTTLYLVCLDRYDFVWQFFLRTSTSALLVLWCCLVTFKAISFVQKFAFFAFDLDFGPRNRVMLSFHLRQLNRIIQSFLLGSIDPFSLTVLLEAVTFVELTLRTLEKLFLSFNLSYPLLHLLLKVPQTGYFARLVWTF